MKRTTKGSSSTDGAPSPLKKSQRRMINKRLYGVSLTSHNTKAVTLEKEEADCKNLYEKALLLQTRKDYDSALSYYWTLLSNQHVSETTIDDDTTLSDLALPADKKLTNSDKSAVLVQMQKNVFLFLKYLALKNVASIYKIQKQFCTACYYYGKALTIDDTDPTVWFHFALCAYETKDYGLTRIALEHTLKHSPKHQLAWQLLMDVLYIIGDFKCCTWVANTILKTDPTNPRADEILRQCSDDPLISLCSRKSNYSLKDLDAKVAETASATKQSSTLEQPEQCEVLELRQEHVTWEGLCRRLLTKYEKLARNGKYVNPLVYISIIQDDDEDENDEDEEIDETSDGEDEATDSELMPPPKSPILDDPVSPTAYASSESESVDLSEPNQEADVEMSEIDINAYEQERLNKIEKHKQRLAELGLGNKIGAAEAASAPAQKITRKRKRRVNNDDAEKRRNPKRMKKAVAETEPDKKGDKPKTPVLSEIASSVLVMDIPDVMQDENANTENSSKELAFPESDGTAEFIKLMNRGDIDQQEFVGSRMIDDWFITLLERLSTHFANHALPTKLRHLVLRIYEKLMKHEVLPGPQCLLKLVELHYAQSQNETSQHLKRSFIVARKLISKISTKLICGNYGRAKSIEDLYSLSDRVRLNWFASLIQYASNNSEASRIRLIECYRLLTTHSIPDITIPNLQSNSVINLQIVKEKLKEFDLDRSLTEAVEKFQLGDSTPALQLFQPQLFDKLKNEMIKCKAIKTLQEIFSKGDIKKLDLTPLQLVSIFEFIFRDVDEAFIKQHEKLFATMLKSFIKLSADKDFTPVPATCRIPAIKHILRFLDYFQQRITERDFSSQISKCFILIYRIGIFKPQNPKYSFLPFMRHIYLTVFKAEKRSKLLFEFLIDEMYKYYRAIEENQSLHPTLVLDDVKKELLNVFYLYYGVKLTTDPKIYQNDDTYRPKLNDDFANLSNNKDHSLLAFTLIREEAISCLQANKETRKEIEKVLSLIYNSFRDLPNECEKIKNSIFSIIDNKDQTALKDETFDLPSVDLSGCKYAEVYQHIHFLLGQYIVKNLTTTATEVLPAIITTSATSIHNCRQYAQGMYFLERALVCDPQNPEIWITLAEKYKTIADCMLDVEDLTDDYQDILHNEEVRSHLRLPTESIEFYLDVTLVCWRAFTAFEVARQLNVPKEQYLFKICLLLATMTKGKESFENGDKRGLVVLRLIEYLKEGCQAFPKDWRYPLLLGIALWEHTNENPDVYLDLMKQSLELVAGRKSDEKNFVLVLYQYQSTRLDLIIRSGDEEKHHDVVVKYNYDAKITKSKSKKAPVTFFDYGNSVDLELPNASENPRSKYLNAWVNIFEGYLACLRIEPYHHKSLYRLCECMAFGPWKDHAKAEFMMSALIRKARAFQSEKPLGFEYKMWIDDTDIFLHKQRTYRKWKQKCTNFFIETLRKTNNLEACSMLCAGFRRKILDTDVFLTTSALFALQMFTKLGVDQYAIDKGTEKEKPLLRYICEAYVYALDPIWEGSKEVKALLDTLRELLKIYELDQVSAKQMMEYVHTNYKVDLSLKPGKVKKKMVTAGKENTPKKKKENKTKKAPAISSGIPLPDLSTPDTTTSQPQPSQNPPQPQQTLSQSPQPSLRPVQPVQQSGTNQVQKSQQQYIFVQEQPNTRPEATSYQARKPSLPSLTIATQESKQPTDHTPPPPTTPTITPTTTPTVSPPSIPPTTPPQPYWSPNILQPLANPIATQIPNPGYQVSFYQYQPQPRVSPQFTPYYHTYQFPIHFPFPNLPPNVAQQTVAAIRADIIRRQQTIPVQPTNAFFQLQTQPQHQQPNPQASTIPPKPSVNEDVIEVVSSDEERNA